MSFLSDRTGTFYDAWEESPMGDRRRFIQRSLKEYLEYARELCPFYRERLQSYRWSDEHPLRGVAVLSSAELRELVPPNSKALVVGNSSDYTVFQSGGTTGVPKTSLFSYAEFAGLDKPNARGFYAMGLNAEDRVANLFAVGGLYMTFLHIHQMLEKYGVQNFPFSNHTPSDFILTVAKLFRINCFTGIASVVLGALREINEVEKDFRVDKILYGGEHLYDADRTELKERFGATVIGAPGYGTVDTWYLGYQCLDCPPGVFHAHDDEAYIELVDEQTGELVPAGTTGMMYATAFLRKLTPIIRYRVGDLAQWTGEPCRCGRTTPLFKLLGRGDDVLRIGYDSIDYASIQDAVAQVAGTSGTIQMEKSRIEGRDQLIVRIESDAPTSQWPSIQALVHQNINERRPSLRQFLEKGTVWPLVIEMLPFGAIPRNARTGKLIRVIDAIPTP